MVVALLIFALCTALIVAMKSEFNLFYQRGANLFHGEQAYAYLRGAEDLAALALVMDFDQDQAREKPRDDLTEIWAQQSTPYALDEGGWLVGNLEDLQGRFNINALAEKPGAAPGGQGSPGEDGSGTESGDPVTAGGAGGAGVFGDGRRFSPAQQQFIRLLQALDDPPVSQQEAIQITESIVDWLDSDNELSPAGAEDDYYYGMTPAHRAANRPMASVSELRAVANMTPEIYCALLPLVSVWPQTPAPLNIHTAPVALLRTVNTDGDLSPLSLADAQTIAEQRGELGFRDLEEFFSLPALEGKEMGELRTLLGENTAYFLLSATVEVADRSTRLYSVLERNQRSITALTRHGGVAEPLCLRNRQREPGSEESGDGTG